MKELEKKVETLDTYTKNKVGYLEGKIVELEKKIEAYDNAIRNIFTFVHPLSVELASTIECLINNKIIKSEDLETVIVKNTEEWVQGMNKKQESQKSQIITP